jgi:protease I
MGDLRGVKVAILITDGFEEVEMVKPRQELVEAGADARIVSPRAGKVKAWTSTEWGKEYPVDVELEQARPQDFDALLLPGGVMNPDKLRMEPNAVEFVRSFFDEGKPVAAICHGPWMVIEAGGASGRRLTSWPSLKTDLRNAGARWVDEEVVVDGTLVSSRKPDDIPAFNREMLKLFAKARREQRPAA